MLEDYREVETKRLPNGTLVLHLRGVVRGRKKQSSKSFSKADDAAAVLAELETEISGETVPPVVELPF